MSGRVWRSALIGAAAHGFSGRAPIDPVAGGPLVLAKQVHGRLCLTVDTPWADDARPEADALVTDRPGLTIGIVTADCAPVLLIDGQAGVVGAAHAGWRGALAGITDACVDAMEALGADRGRIVAAVGPCIARASYEVDAPLFDAFTRDDPANERFFSDTRPGHWLFDLEAYVGARLAGVGVTRVDLMGLDTYAREADFYSFRRATHRGEPTGGRQTSMIGIVA